MSYILEALKRSQAERELGRVPTLERATLLGEERVEPPRGRWALVAVGLAATAVLIALYAALRGPDAVPTVAPGAAVVARADPAPSRVAEPPIAQPQVVSGAARPLPTPVGADPATRLAPGQDVTAPGNLILAAADPVVGLPALPFPPGSLPPAVPATPAGALVPRPAGLLPPAPAVAGTPGAAPAAAPLVEAPPPKGASRVPPPVAVPAGPPRPPAPPPSAPVSVPAAPADTAAQLELEMQRQLASDPATAQDAGLGADGVAAPEPEPEPVPEEPTPVPPGLIADIDAFKHQVKGGHGKGKDAAAPGPAGDPTQLRLTREQQAALPKLLLNVHVFDADQARRFVVINGLRYAQGAKTREGVTIEEIRVDGVVLNHQGHPFFVHR